MVDEEVVTVAVKAFGPGGAELGMTRAEMLEQINHIDSSIMVTLQFEAQIIFGWLVAMFFVAHRLSRMQMLLACAFFLAVGLLNLGVLAAAISRVDYWSAMLFAATADASAAPGGAYDVFLSVVSNGWFQLVLILALYTSCIWWGYSCRKNQKIEIGSPF